MYIFTGRLIRPDGQYWGIQVVSQRSTFLSAATELDMVAVGCKMLGFHFSAKKGQEISTGESYPPQEPIWYIEGRLWTYPEGYDSTLIEGFERFLKGQ